MTDTPEPNQRSNVCAECGRPAIGMFGDTWFCQSCGDKAFKNWHKPLPIAKHPEAQNWQEWRELEQQQPGKEPNQEPVKLEPIDPYPHTSPGQRSRPGDTPPSPEVSPIPEAQHVRIQEPSRSPLPARTKPFLPARREPIPAQEYTIPVSPGRERTRPEVPTSQAEPVTLNHPVVTEQFPERQTTTSPLPEVSPETEVKPEKRKKEFPQTPETEKVSSGNGSKTTSGSKNRGVSGSKHKTLPLFNGRAGRKHKEWQIEDILDNYLQTGRLPHYVSDRQHRLYKTHRTLPERRKLLNERGKTIVIPETSSAHGNIVSIQRGKSHSSKRKAGSI